MSKPEQELAFYREQISKWRWKNWSWERIRMEDRGRDGLERKLEGWSEDGAARLTPEEWLALVREAEEKERWEFGKDAVDSTNPDEMKQYFEYRLAKAPTKVGKLLKQLQAGDFARARDIASGRVALPGGFGSKTLADLREWLQRWDPTPVDTSAEVKESPVPLVTEDHFRQKLEEAPENIQYIISELEKHMNLRGAADFCQLDIDGVASAVKIKKVGKKSWEHLKKWQRELVAPRQFPCADYQGWGAWLGAVFEDILEFAGIVNPKASLKMFEQRMGLDCENAGPLPTLDEIGQAQGMTRERVRQIEEKFLTGGDSLQFRGVAGNLEKFGDFMRIMREVFGEDGVLSMDEFGKRLAERSPWPGEDCRYRAARLLAVLDSQPPDQVPGFVTFNQQERVDGRYEIFKEVVEKNVVRRLDASFEALRWAMADYGVKDFKKDEFEYCRARVAKEQDAPIVRRMVRAPTKGDRVRQAILELFEPESGYHELTMKELEQGLMVKLRDNAPNLHGFLNRTPPVDLDGKGTHVCLVDQGGGTGRISHYALSKFLPELDSGIIRKMEEELLAHLKEYQITAALVTPFYERWKAKGWVPERMAPRLLFDTLRRGSTRTIVDYPDGNSSWAYSLPGAKLPGMGLLKAQAMRYFRGKAVVPRQALMEFAEHGFGLAGAIIKIECARQFTRTKDGMCIINESLLEP